MSRPDSNILIYADGSAGQVKVGVAVVIQNNKGRVLHLQNWTLESMTNNEAEYMGLLMGLQLVIEHRYESVEIRLDSEIVINQMVGRFAVNSKRLKPLHRKACELAQTLPNIRYRCIPRDENRLADALAADAAAGRNLYTARR